ncbi:MAG: hypothetical protein GY822_22960 [Deltaproteobacteria bacterium]|nr:hypothetical protein [Deltaproteobacteria bacterium]
MARPLSGEFRLGRKLITGSSDPSGLRLDFTLDDNHIFIQRNTRREDCHGARVVPLGLLQDVADDLAHAVCAAKAKRLGLTRESRLRFLKPIYAGAHFRADAKVARSTSDLVTVEIRILNDKGAICCEGQVEIFILQADVVRRMTPDGMIPLELRRFFSRD